MKRHRRDPFDLLVQLKPPPAEAPLPPGADPFADDLLAAVLAGTASASQPFDVAPEQDRRLRRGGSGRARRFAVMAVVGASALGAGAIAAVWQQRPSDTVSLACYSDAAVEPRAIVGTAVAVGKTPVDLCASLWSDGTFGRSGAPELTPCVTADGTTAVIPGDSDVCARIGLAQLVPTDAGDDASDEIDRSVAEAISALFAGRCIDDEAVALESVEAELARLDATSWRVGSIARFDAERRCAAPVVDVANRVVQIAAVPG